MHDEDEAAGRWLLAKGEAAFDALYEWMTTVPVVVPDAVLTPLTEIKEAAKQFRVLEEKQRELDKQRELVMECLRFADPRPEPTRCELRGIDGPCNHYPICGEE